MQKGISLAGLAPRYCRISAEVAAADECMIEGLTFTNLVWCDGVSPLIVGNAFNLPADGTMPAILVTGPAHLTIARNFIAGGAEGIDGVWPAVPLIRNNILFKPGGVAIDLQTIDERPQILNNTIVGAKYIGIRVGRGSIQNNIIVGDTGGLSSAFQGAIIDNNPMVDSVTVVKYNDIWNTRDKAIPWPGNLWLDPKLGAQLHLLPGSPCQDAGNPDGSLRDHDGSRNDMGAYGGPDPYPEGAGMPLIRSVMVGKAVGSPGDTVEIAVTVDMAAGLTGLSLGLGYDANGLRFLGARTTLTTQGAELESGTPSPGVIRLTLASTIAFPAGGNELVRLLFMIRPTNIIETYPLRISSVSLIDDAGASVFLNDVTNGYVAVTWSHQSVHTLFVDASAGAVQDGTAEHPFRSISQAVTIARDGDSVFVAPGQYRDSVVIKQAIHLIGSGAAVTTILGSGMAANSRLISFEGCTTCEVSGFTVAIENPLKPWKVLLSCRGTRPLITRNRFVGAPGGMDPTVWLADCPGGTFENNYMQEATMVVQNSSTLTRNNVVRGKGSGVTAMKFDGGQGYTVASNVFEQGANLMVAGVDGQGTPPIIRNNRITMKDVGTVAFSLVGCSKVKLYNNIIDGPRPGTYGIFVARCKDLELINNTIVTHQSGYSEAAEPSAGTNSALLLNNIFAGNREFAVQSSPVLVSDYNDLWGNFINYTIIPPAPHDIQANPMFVDSSGGDFRLAAGSPCMNAGSPEPRYADCDGSRNDIGAYGGPYADTAQVTTAHGRIVIDSATVEASDTVMLRVLGEGLSGTAFLDISLSYDPQVLQVEGAVRGSLTKQFALETSLLSGPGHLSLRLAGRSGITEGSGELVSVMVKVLAQEETKTTVTLDSVVIISEVAEKREGVQLRNGLVSIVPKGSGPAPQMPQVFQLMQNFPNPFNPLTTIRYALPCSGYVTLTVFNLLGEKIVDLIKGNMEAGYHEVQFDARKLASGVYFYRLQAGAFNQVRSMALVR